MKKIFTANMSKGLTFFIYGCMMLVLLFYCVNILSYLQTSILTSIVIICGILLFYFICYHLGRYFQGKFKKFFPLFILTVSLILYGIVGLLHPLKLVSDYRVLYEGAGAMLRGDFARLSFDVTNYFYFYNFQIGYTAILAIIMRLLGEQFFILHIFEITIQVGTNVLLYLIVKNYFNEQHALLSTLLYTTFIFNILGSNILNNQHLSLFFVALGIFAFIQINKTQNCYYTLLYAFLTGGCFALAYLVRQTAIVFILAFFVSVLLKLLHHENMGKKKILLVHSFLILCSYWSVLHIIDTTIVHLGIAPQSTLTANTKYFKFWLGISQTKGVFNTTTTDAEHTQVYYDLAELDFDYDQYNQITKDKLITAYTTDLPITANKIWQKMCFYSGEVDHQYTFALASDEQPEYIISIGHIQYFLLIVLTLISSFLVLKKQQENSAISYFTLVFLAVFCAYIFIEVQTRYRYEQYFVLAIIGGMSFLQFIKNWEQQIGVTSAGSTFLRKFFK